MVILHRFLLRLSACTYWDHPPSDPLGRWYSERLPEYDWTVDAKAHKHMYVWMYVRTYVRTYVCMYVDKQINTQDTSILHFYE